ncbi:ABC transporter A family member 5 [Chlorella vulgaris]
MGSIKQDERLRQRASLWTQTGALVCKQASFQKRKWMSNAVLLAAPFIICMLLWVLQEVINQQLDARAFRCGCKCLSCCDWVSLPGSNMTGAGGSGTLVYQCYQATDDRPCSPYAKCQAYNDSVCGFLYSTAEQVAYCPVEEPPLWPALMEVPRVEHRGPKVPAVMPEALPSPGIPPSDAPMLFTGDDPAAAQQLMQAMWGRGQSITDAVLAAYVASQAGGSAVPTSTEGQRITSEHDFVEAAAGLSRGLYDFDLTMGTSAATSLSLLMEPGFVAQSSSDSNGTAARPPLYFSLPNCSALSPTWQPDASQINDQVYCGWRGSDCVLRAGQKVYLPADAAIAAHSNSSTQAFVSAYDWLNTSLAGLNVTVWVNNSDVGGGEEAGAHPPSVQRWTQPVNLAANAFLKRQLGPGYSARLVGLMLPVGVHTLVQEKEQHLRGLSDPVYYLVMWAWNLLLYCAFVFVFCVFGGLIGLKIFTLNSYSLQAAFYILWGLAITSWTFYFSALWNEARPAVLLAVIWVIISGFMANLVMVQYIEQGPPWLAQTLQVIPSFNLYRGLYELSQYAFLADRTGGSGLTWSKLGDGGNGMVSVLLLCVIEGVVFMWLAFYLEQVRGAGTGIRRHRLFFLGFKLIEKEASQSRQRWRWSWRRKAVPVGSAAPKKGAASAGLKQQQGGLELAVAAGGGPNGLAPAAAGSLQDDGLLDYYGSHSGGPEQLRSPQLPQRGAAANGVATLPQLLPRKPTSLRLSMTPEPSSGILASSLAGAGGAGDEGEGSDVAAERLRVESLWQQWQLSPGQQPPAAIMLRSLRKVFPSADGNAEKIAVADLSLAIKRCECFGLLGPNGAGKTTTIRMMEGFMAATSGQALVEGLDIGTDMDQVYALTGACPQHDLLWDGLTGREHLLFYARIKAFKGKRLRRAVDDALRSVNLLSVGNELVGGYSGGMKRRLSVAISLVGDPLVVYLDEPSTGLDPASRQLLWNVIRKARKERAVVLTTHSMEEAEALLGIFVGGRLQCLGDPQDLISRFGGYLSFSITTPVGQEAAAAAVVRGMSPSARLVYALGGAQKFELPVGEAGVDSIFRRMEQVKARQELDLVDWGVSNATLEEVFIRIIRDAGVQVQAFA